MTAFHEAPDLVDMTDSQALAEELASTPASC